VTVFIGTSGWQYRHWRQTFYPQGVPQARWLEFFAERFQIVELNNSFYRLPPPQNFTKWRERTPDDFIVAAKMSRYLTHIKKLKEPEEPVERFFRHARNLGHKLGPVLLQLPPTLKADVEALDRVLSIWPEDVRVSVEPRHETWFGDELKDVLVKHGAALCLANRHDQDFTPWWRTTDWTFVRFHEGTGRPHPCYKKSSLDAWARRLAADFQPDEDIYVFFNNDPRACALRDAIVFADLMADLGFEHTRVPSRREVKVGDIDTAAWATSS
jgi:uncharacterized protein YecE (DUF72 family)